MEIFIIPIAILIISFWILMFKFDKKRVREYLENRGDTVISINWKLFGKGWLSESNKDGGGNRIYLVVFKDIYGNTKQAWCKTAILSGVFLTDESITEQAQSDGKPLSAEAKIALLEDEVRKLRAGNNQ